ncbi:hypothetical protein [Gordonia shandongensis]|uniref:hypothetical protein n=1 Tax=Gordonia shandongensis TaxID=376351 RepID=UPI000414FC2F|nr:hypothetical protein [Gordonia shandongensis]
MQSSTSSTLTSKSTTSKFTEFVHRIAERMNQSATERLNLQLANMPVAVLGSPR